MASKARSRSSTWPPPMRIASKRSPGRAASSSGPESARCTLAACRACGCGGTPPRCGSAACRARRGESIVRFGSQVETTIGGVDRRLAAGERDARPRGRSRPGSARPRSPVRISTPAARRGALERGDQRRRAAGERGGRRWPRAAAGWCWCPPTRARPRCRRRPAPRAPRPAAASRTARSGSRRRTSAPRASARACRLRPSCQTREPLAPRPPRSRRAPFGRERRRRRSQELLDQRPQPGRNAR